MAGEKNIKILLKNMSPVLITGDFVFCTLPHKQFIPQEKIIGSFQEVEGTTVILAKEEAVSRNLSYDVVMAQITLKVHSSLEAVGLTAAVATALAKEGISCNVVAAYYHDHLFVPKADGERAVQILEVLAL